MAITGDDRRTEGAEGAVRPGALTALLEELATSPPPSGEHGPALRAGDAIGRFELVRELGRGGFGVVWEARDRELGRSVALKLVRPSRTRDVREERLVREAEAAALLSHPNIVTLHDVGRSEHGPYLVLELLAGRTLAARLGQGPLAPAEAVRIALEVSAALGHAHAHGVVHRDLKPENVFLCDGGVVKVLDFGLAHAFGRKRADGGTPAYMAPEQLDGAPEDERTDVFALGVMLFEMLTGRRPFEDARALRSAAAAPTVDVPSCPALGSLLSRMLAKEAVRRPRDGAEVAQALSAVAPELERVARSGGAGRVRTRRRPGIRVAALVAAGVVLGAGTAALLVGRSGTDRAPGEPASIAVLPFADMSPAKDQEYLADGVAEEILSSLSRIDGLRVVGRTSSFHFKARGDDLREIGKRLYVTSVLEGSVRRSGDRIRVTAQLVNVADGYRVWSESYDRPAGDILALEDDIARAVVAGLRVKLLPSGAADAGKRTASPEAHAELLRGRHLAARGTEKDLRAAIQAYERAIELDPAYALAYAALSAAWSNLPYAMAEGVDWVGGADKARAAAERAIELDPRLAEGYSARALYVFASVFDWEWARADLERALSLDPRDVPSRTRYGILLAALGRLEEAVAAARGVLLDDPLNVAAAWTLGSYLNALGRYAEAREVLDRALEVAQEGRLLRERCFTDILEGRPAAALALAERIPIDYMQRTVQAIAHHDLGHDREAREALEWLALHSATVGYQLAEVHAWRGEVDESLRWLERARAARDPGVRYVKYDPLLRKLRGDPRYAAFLRDMKLGE